MSKKKPSADNSQKLGETDRDSQLYDKAIDVEVTMAELLYEQANEMEAMEFLRFMGLVLSCLADRHFVLLAPGLGFDELKIRGFILTWANDIADKVCSRVPEIREMIRLANPNG